ncbi:hypothetical protein HGRIS_002424 [Hohenbuehelia grisea]|uniref:Uncharacterized protein n=1 Tax=Hohenbuehelia grisea TaxID=104357 RepID=A0ABR3JKG8_9AGAR
MNYCQGLARLGHVDDIHRGHPDLDPGQRRLNMTRSEGADHLNYRVWLGDVISELADTPLGIQSSCTFQHSVDLLRPFGGDKYPGVETDVDRSEEVEIGAAISGVLDPLLENSQGPTSASHGDTLEDDPDILTLEESLECTPELLARPGVTPDQWLLSSGEWYHTKSICQMVINKNYAAKSDIKLVSSIQPLALSLFAIPVLTFVRS